MWVQINITKSFCSTLETNKTFIVNQLYFNKNKYINTLKKLKTKFPVPRSAHFRTKGLAIHNQQQNFVLSNVSRRIWAQNLEVTSSKVTGPFLTLYR